MVFVEVLKRALLVACRFYGLLAETVYGLSQISELYPEFSPYLDVIINCHARRGKE
ncbi:hypothetical protein ED5_0176 [Enterobacter roggenkampii]|jgi:hypothetical protein|nr:hypothetical protein ED5_0176 [Enterobacter roggenkampii]